MSLESFYGGKQGLSSVIKKAFRYISTDDPAYQKDLAKLVNVEIGNNNTGNNDTTGNKKPENPSKKKNKNKNAKDDEGKGKKNQAKQKKGKQQKSRTILKEERDETYGLVGFGPTGRGRGA